MDYGVVKMNEWAKVGSRYKDRRSRSKSGSRMNRRTQSEQRERPEAGDRGRAREGGSSSNADGKEGKEPGCL